jgi:hypothetical protein
MIKKHFAEGHGFSHAAKDCKVMGLLAPALLQSLLLYVVGLNETSIETKINPKVINNNPHHRSNHETDSFEALIPNILQIPL